MRLEKNRRIAEIGIFGGSGFYDLLQKFKEIEIKTPYGLPSDKVAIGEYNGKKIAFLPRHGKGHIYPPHKIPYRANLYAFKSLGVKRIIAPSASGSLNSKIKPGDFVICDQFVDRTKNRRDTFYEKENYGTPSTVVNRVAHVSSAEPYCENLRKIAIKSCEKFRSSGGHNEGGKIKCHKKGTVVVIEGPRFSTTAESRWFQSEGWDVINMTQYPENILARELEMCYVNISLITDYDAGLILTSEERNKNIFLFSPSDVKTQGLTPFIDGKKLNPHAKNFGVGVKPVDTKEVVRVFNENNEKVKKLIFEIIKNIPLDLKCSCETAMRNAFFN